MFENFPDAWQTDLRALSDAPLCKIAEYNFERKSMCAVLSFDGLHTIFYLYTCPCERKKGYATQLVREVLRVHERPLFARYKEHEVGPRAVFKKNGFKEIYQAEDTYIIAMHNENS